MKYIIFMQTESAPIETSSYHGVGVIPRDERSEKIRQVISLIGAPADLDDDMLRH
jgi:hypothetical protein